MLVEQCQPLRDSSLQNQEEQWHYEEMEYGLQEHNYVSHRETDSQMAYVRVKQEVRVNLSSRQIYSLVYVILILKCASLFYRMMMIPLCSQS